MSPELAESRFATCLELAKECCTSATQDCEVFVKSETVPLTEELMQTELLKGTGDFESDDFVVLKDKGLVVTIKELIELSTVLEDKVEQGTEAALSLWLGKVF